MGFHKMGFFREKSNQMENHPMLANEEGAAWLGNGSFSVTLRDGRKQAT